MVPGDDAEHVGGARRSALLADHHGHEAVAPPHAADHVEHDLVAARDDEIAGGQLAERGAAARPGFGEPLAQAGIDAQDAGDAVAFGHDDVAHAAAIIGGAQKRRKARLRRQDGEIGVHDLARAAHQEHVGVQRLRHEMAAPVQLERIDVLARQQPARADAERHGDDHRHDDVVVARHLEDHRDRGHHRAGAAADHRPHPDQRKARRVDRHRQREHATEARRRRRRSSRP